MMTTDTFAERAAAPLVLRYPSPYSVASAPPVSTTPRGRNLGLLFAGVTFIFSAVLLSIAFAVTLRTFLDADAHWAANTALTSEARALGLQAVKGASSIRLVIFGPSALLVAVAAIVAMVAGTRRD